MAFQVSALPVRTSQLERGNSADGIIEHRGGDDGDLAFGVECDVGALEGLEYEVAEHTTVESGEDSRATDSTTLSGIICCAKGESFLLCGGGSNC